MYECGDIVISTGICVHCSDCDPAMEAAMRIEYYDLARWCKQCSGLMVSYHAYAYELLLHGAGCTQCVESAVRETRHYEDVALTGDQYRLLQGVKNPGDIAVAVADGSTVDEAIADLVLATLTEAI